MRSLLHLRPYFKRYRLKLLVGLVFILGSNGSALLIPLFVKDAIESIQAKSVGPAMDAAAKAELTHNLLYLGLLIAAAAAFSAVCRFFIRQTLIVLSREIEFDLRRDLWAHVQRLPMRYFSQHSTGEVMAHLTNDVNAVRMFLGPSVMYTFDNLSKFIMVMAVLLMFSVKLTLVSLLPLPILSFLVYFVGQKIHSRFNAIQESFADLTSRAQQTFSGIRVIKSYVREAHQEEAFEAQSRDYLDKQLHLLRLESFYRPLLYAVPGTSLLLVIWVGGGMVMSGEDGITLGLLAAYMVFLTGLIWPMIAFGWVVNVTQRAAASMTRLLRVMEAPAEIVDPEHPATPPEPRADVPAVEFRDVSFRYTPEGTEVLHGLNLKVMHGETLAVVGRTGSGKSTLVQLIPRLYDVSSGQVLVDGVDVREWPLMALRERIGMAPQEAFLFSDTLASNLVYGRPEADEASRQRAVEIAQLDKDVLDFPKGYETILGERGITLSGGQKQRASLARALLREPPILILDDTLSAVDAQTEEDILEGLRGREGSTGVVISHRLSTIQHADQILVMEDGSLVEQGTHDSLVAQDGRYADVYRKQLLESELQRI